MISRDRSNISKACLNALLCCIQYFTDRVILGTHWAMTHREGCAIALLQTHYLGRRI